LGGDKKMKFDDAVQSGSLWMSEMKSCKKINICIVNETKRCGNYFCTNYANIPKRGISEHNCYERDATKY